ncbi:MAG: 16S rRNA (uracil(1498)-N(3))-methyltransferase, partial [Candidatus Omnitrophica bacterium]|nr:16S rRNA (uracil(1498)-N(3))-methyltransferase [Candidatus Omnitrophota bacterium]
MYRFFSPSASVSSSLITVRDPAQVHHIRNTLRLGKGAGVLVFDEKERTYEAVIEECARGAVTLKIMKRKRQRVPGRPRLTIACALPKQAKMDDIVDKLTQLGVDRIIPLKTQRVIVKWSREKERLRRERWQKIALEACQQSQRESIPSIDEVTVLDSLI